VPPVPCSAWLSMPVVPRISAMTGAEWAEWAEWGTTNGATDRRGALQNADPMAAGHHGSPWVTISQLNSFKKGGQIIGINMHKWHLDHLLASGIWISITEQFQHIMLISWQLELDGTCSAQSFPVLAIQLNIRAHVLKQSETTNNGSIKHGTWMYMVVCIYIYVYICIRDYTSIYDGWSKFFYSTYTVYIYYIPGKPYGHDHIFIVFQVCIYNIFDYIWFMVIHPIMGILILGVYKSI
jgi:hypothetical protein